MGIKEMRQSNVDQDSLESSPELSARVSRVLAKPTDQIIARMQAVRPWVRRRHFAKALSVVSDSRVLYAAARGIIPDAYEVADGVVTIFEVADTHPIRASKAERIADLFDELEEYGWELWVTVLDYMGGTTAHVPGWCYQRALEIAPANCMDMTPAALYAYLEAKACQS